MAETGRVHRVVKAAQDKHRKGSGGKKETKTKSTIDRLTEVAEQEKQVSEHDKLQGIIRRLHVDLQAEKAKLRRSVDSLNALQDRVELAEATYNPSRRYQIGAGGKKEKASCTALVLLSDLHLEEKVDPDVCMGNRYDLEIAKRRNDRVMNTMIDVLESHRRFYPWKDLVIWLGGDMISGAIHQELEATNFVGPGEAILFAQDLMLANIDHLRKNLQPRSVTVVANMGNHGRTTHRKRFADGYNHSWEWLAYHNMARLFRNDPAIRFVIAKGSLIEVEIETVPVRFTHGDDLRFEGGVGGVFIPLAKKIANWDKRWKAQKTILGHFHQHFHISNAIMNGCLIGPNAYSIAGGFDAQRPSQTTAIVDSRRGFVDVTQIFAE